MLLHLLIQNYAIIDEISIDFTEGLQIITGETGAGKSIIAGALSLVLGERSDTAVLKDRTRKAVVEADFRVSHIKEVENFLQREELDHEKELVIRREIAANGKSRAFINDTPVNLEQLRRLSLLLVDLHQQFDILSLGEAGFQLAVVDALAGNSLALNSYRKIYHRVIQTRNNLNDLKDKQARAEKEMDYQKFLFNELDEASIKENEFEEADLLLKRQSHAEAIKAVLSGIHSKMEESDQPIVQQLRMFAQQLEVYKAYNEKFPELIQRLNSAFLELQDLSSEMESIGEDVDFDAAEIEKLNERIHTGYKLFKKHGVGTTSALLEIRDKLKLSLEETLNLAEEIFAGEKQLEKELSEANALAKTLSVKRKTQIAPLEANVNALLKKVGMPNARLRIECTDCALYEKGADQIEFLFDANKSDRFEPIKKVASGGELSRLMLCIKSLVAKSMDMPTLLFDEIDSGISGEAAKQVGIILKELSSRRQVICITHQPQIAGKGDAHFYVYKEKQGNQLQTKIRLLDTESRILIIAKMISGEKPTPAAMENARELVN